MYIYVYILYYKLVKVVLHVMYIYYIYITCNTTFINLYWVFMTCLVLQLTFKEPSEHWRESLTIM